MSEQEIVAALQVSEEHPMWRAVCAVIAQHQEEWMEAALSEGKTSEARHYNAGASKALLELHKGLSGLRAKAVV